MREARKDPGRRDALGFLAFVQLHRARYLRYARVRLLDEVACRVAVDVTLTLLADRWPEVLETSCPTAEAWGELRHQTARVGRDTGHRNEALESLYEWLPNAAADAVVLRCQLGMPEREAADLMGVEPPTVAVGMLAASRKLSIGEVPTSRPASRSSGEMLVVAPE
ncbi:hypothetical protein [Streptomyces sp. NPDC054863]